MVLKRMRIGVVGYGNLGKATVRLLDMKREAFRAEGLDLVLTCVLDQGGGVYHPEGLDCAALTEHAEYSRTLEGFPGFDPAFTFKKIIDGKMIDLMVEFTFTNKETGEPGLTHIRECLSHGIHVTTGNKGPILVAWEELSALAREKRLLLGISCTTGGALPTIINGREAMAGSEVTLIEGVLNGTTNFILDRMETSGVSYEEALKEARLAGIAEADPTMDVEGWDTATKLLILSQVVMHGKLGLRDISVTGITDVAPEDIRNARATGHKIKLIGKAWREDGRVCAKVAPQAIDADHPFYFVSARNKGVRYISDTMGDLFIAGGASGPLPAAAAALRDVVNAWHSGLLG